MLLVDSVLVGDPLLGSVVQGLALHVVVVGDVIHGDIGFTVGDGDVDLEGHLRAVEGKHYVFEDQPLAEDGTELVLLTIVDDHGAGANLIGLVHHLRQLLEQDVENLVGSLSLSSEGGLPLHHAVHLGYGVGCQVLGVGVVLRLFFYFDALPGVVLSGCQQRHHHHE